MNKRIKIFIDESGTFHDGETKFFVLGGIVLNEEHENYILRKYRELILEYTRENNIPILSKNFELKSSSIRSKNYSKQIGMIEKIGEKLYDLEAILFTLVVDVKKHKSYSSLDSIKNSENLRYNFFVKNLLLYLIKDYKNSIDDFKVELVICCDNRSVKVNLRKELENYLNTEICNVDMGIDSIKVDYFNSANNHLIQLADMVAGLKFKEYNRNSNFTNEDLERIFQIKNLYHKRHN